MRFVRALDRQLDVSEQISAYADFLEPAPRYKLLRSSAFVCNLSSREESRYPSASQTRLACGDYQRCEISKFEKTTPSRLDQPRIVRGDMS